MSEVLGETWDAKDNMGDRWLYARAEAMAAPTLPHPVLAVVAPSERATVGRLSAQLTEDGIAVLEGRAHAVRLNGPGFLEPIGGVRFDGPGAPLWLRTPDGVTRA